MTAATIYKLMTRAEWEAVRESGVYRGSEHDLRDGFIHFSTAQQLAETARKHFSGVPDLVLLAVDSDLLLSPPSPQPSPASSPWRACQSAWPQTDAAGERVGVRGSCTASTSLRWEPSRGGDLFPHLYTHLPLSAVKSAIPIPLAADGIPILPQPLPS
jgi:uncharacterized protein (DUF952 family)